MIRKGMKSCQHCVHAWGAGEGSEKYCQAMGARQVTVDVSIRAAVDV